MLSGLSVVSASAASSVDLQQQVDHQLQIAPGGTQVSADTVSYDGGNVLVVFQSDARERQVAALAVDWKGCPTGTFVHWTCLYEAPGWRNRRVQFKDCGYVQDLADYGFANQASSWVNTRYDVTRVYDGGFRLLWTEEPRSLSYYVGNDKGDRARYIRLEC
jgi:hypothetical protein